MQELKDIETRTFGKGKRKKGGGGVGDDDDNADSQGVRKRLKGSKKVKKYKKWLFYSLNDLLSLEIYVLYRHTVIRMDCCICDTKKT